jgi:hypothetical protein
MAFSTHEPASFETLELILQGAGALAQAAEAHGSFCGSVCLLGPQAASAWIAEILADSDQSDLLAHGSTDALWQVAGATYERLEEGDMSFVMLLPSDDEELAQRTAELAKWCQGFMHGLSVAGANDPVAIALMDSGIMQEVLHDFSEITGATVTSGEHDIEDEAAYMELVEYVRASVQLLFEETVALRSGQSLAASNRQ